MTPIEKLRAAIKTIDFEDREVVFTLGTDSVDALKAALADTAAASVTIDAETFEKMRVAAAQK